MQRIKGPPGGTAEIQRDAVTIQDLLAQWFFYDEALGIIWENRLSYLAGRPKQLVFLTDEGPDSDPFRSDDDPEWIRELKRYTTSADAATRDEAREILRSEEWQHMNRIERNIEPIRYELDKKIEEKKKSWNTDVAQARGEGKPHMRGGGAPTDDQHNIYKRISAEAYSSSPEATIDGYSLVSSTPTLKVYKKGDHVIVGVRGTDPTDINDLSADASIAFNRLGRTNRARIDIAAVEALRKQYPTAVFAGAGHSLGGAVIDEMIKRGLLQSARSYNPAVQLSNETDTNTRVYNENDPLYLVGKQFLKTTPTVLAGIPGTNPHFLDSLVGSGHHMHAGKMAIDGRNRRYGAMQGGMKAMRLLSQGRFHNRERDCVVIGARALKTHYPEAPLHVIQRAGKVRDSVVRDLSNALGRDDALSFTITPAEQKANKDDLDNPNNAINRRLQRALLAIRERGTSGWLNWDGHVTALISEPDPVLRGHRLVAFEPTQEGDLTAESIDDRLKESYGKSVVRIDTASVDTVRKLQKVLDMHPSMGLDAVQVFTRQIDYNDPKEDNLHLDSRGFAHTTEARKNIAEEGYPAVDALSVEAMKVQIRSIERNQQKFEDKLQRLKDKLSTIREGDANWEEDRDQVRREIAYVEMDALPRLRAAVEAHKENLAFVIRQQSENRYRSLPTE